MERRWFTSWIEENPSSTWVAAEKAFLMHFSNPHQMAMWAQQLDSLRMDERGCQHFVDRFLHLSGKLGKDLTDPTLIYLFHRGLEPHISRQVEAATVNQTLGLELAGLSQRVVLSVKHLASMAIGIAANESIHESTSADKLRVTVASPNKSIQCGKCGRMGHKTQDCRSNTYVKSGGMSGNVVSPIVAELKKSNPNGQSGSVEVRAKKPFVPTCYRCGQVGHTRPSCPQKPSASSVKKTVISVDADQSNSDIALKVIHTLDQTSTPVFGIDTFKADSVMLEQSLTLDSVSIPPSPVSHTSVLDLEEVKSVDGAANAANIRDRCVHTPCFLQGERVIVFVDSGASSSCISRSWVQQRGIAIKPVAGTLSTAIDGVHHVRIGMVENLLLENGTKSIRVDLEVVDLFDDNLIIGIDLFKPLGFTLVGVPFTWPQTPETVVTHKDNVSDSQLLWKSLDLLDNGTSLTWQRVLQDNQSLPIDSRCKLLEAELAIETAGNPVWICQYPIAEGYRAAVDLKVAEWERSKVIVPAPSTCQWNLPLLAVRKPSKEIGVPDGVRVCVDARPLNDKIIRTPDSSLPGLREIQDKLGGFTFITLLDLSDGYNQFPVRQCDQVKTAFTWNGRQWMFTGVPFGLKIMTAHMQRFMERLLGPYGVFPFQDDIAIATKGSKEDHEQAVLKVLEVLTYDTGLRCY